MRNGKIICVNIIIFLNFIFPLSGVLIKDDTEEPGLEEIFMDIKLLKELYKLRKSMANLNSRLEDHTEIVDNKTQDLPTFDVRVDGLSEKCPRNIAAKNCAEATSCTKRSGIYEIQIEQHNGSVPFLVACDVATADGDWLIIQRRQDGSEDFFRDWQEYQNGFGDVHGEFFIGLDKLYALTNYQGPQELLVVVENRRGIRKFAKYTNFAIGNETDQYALKTLGKYSGTSGDSLGYHVGIKWTTKDNDNDHNPDVNCAQNMKAAWWYKACYNSNLNGRYNVDVYWKTFTGSYNDTLSFVQMMIRRQRSHNLLAAENTEQTCIGS